VVVFGTFFEHPKFDFGTHWDASAGRTDSSPADKTKYIPELFRRDGDADKTPQAALASTSISFNTSTISRVAAVSR